MQEKSDGFHTFILRTDRLAARLGGLEEVPAKMGISRAMLYSYRGGRNPITTKAWKKLFEAEQRAGIVAEREPAVTSDYVRGRMKSPVSILPSADYGLPPPSITREQIESRVSAYLDAAERVPGGLGFAWGQVCLHLDISRLSALEVPPEDKKF